MRLPDYMALIGKFYLVYESFWNIYFCFFLTQGCLKNAITINENGELKILIDLNKFWSKAQ